MKIETATAVQQARPIDRSLELWERAKRLIPCGTQCYSKGPTAYSEGFAPIYLQRGKGCRVWDVDGNEFIDMGMGLWAVTLGHANPRHGEAVARAQAAGSQLSLMHPLEVELAQRLTQLIPVAEMVRYGKNGSDVTTAAVRLARTVTGREVILRCGYHGWHDWYVAHSEHSRGVPAFNRQVSGRFDYHHPASFDALMALHEGKVAGVIMEGIQAQEVDLAFLHHVREATRRAGALMIFDEVINGYRFAIGGAHQHLGIDVDLATFGKGIANGTPLSAIVGKREWMKGFEETFFSLTFGGETVGLAAALEVLAIYEEERVVDVLDQLGQRLRAELLQAVRDSGLEGRITVSPHSRRTLIEAVAPDSEDSLLLKSLLQQEMLRRGVLWGGWHALSLAMARDRAAQDQVINAYGEALQVVQRAVETDTVRLQLEGRPIAPIFKRH
ncbi:MAG TPA: aminotransferase class III-fold pyridoxal phosphate-dependent enzyme [Chthoniobacteraceae bacterium]|nr:aminotransferase class III-fold pyridoxal phosphate-dependent enzyme [Chthoniobacteraceae bacterium]